MRSCSSDSSFLASDDFVVHSKRPPADASASRPYNAQSIGHVLKDRFIGEEAVILEDDPHFTAEVGNFAVPHVV